VVHIGFDYRIRAWDRSNVSDDLVGAVYFRAVFAVCSDASNDRRLCDDYHVCGVPRNANAASEVQTLGGLWIGVFGLVRCEHLFRRGVDSQFFAEMNSPKLKIAARLQLSSEQIEALTPIGKRIRVCWDEANCQAARARSAGNDAVKAALLCGEALLEGKGILGHGKWLPWLERHCADIARSIVTAQHWMRLASANKKGCFYLEEAQSLTDAYRKVGILPELPERVSGDGTAGAREMTIDWLVGKLSGLRNVREAARGAMKSWSQEQRRKLAEELRPLIELYHELIPEAA
jgi:hypothetical protein